MIENVLDIFIAKKLTGEPFSFIRFGDGESMVMNMDNDPDHTSFVLNKQFGYMPTLDEQSAIRKELIRSFSMAELIGIADTGMKTDNLFWKNQREQLQKYTGVADGKMFCSMNAHIQLMNEPKFYEFMKSFNRIVFITGREFDTNILPGLEVVNIPCEHKYFSKQNNHYPEVYNKVLDWISKQDLRGALVLVGGGVLGKIYTVKASERGAIALDMGSVFDTWSGYVTRGKDKGTLNSDNLLQKYL